MKAMTESEHSKNKQNHDNNTFGTVSIITACNLIAGIITFGIMQFHPLFILLFALAILNFPISIAGIKMDKEETFAGIGFILESGAISILIVLSIIWSVLGHF